MNVGLSKEVDVKKLEKLLSKYFKGKTVYINYGFPDDDWADIVCTIDITESEFPYNINFWTIKVADSYNICMGVAKFLSKKLHCSTICDGTEHGDDDSPYWSIIWDNGKSFLADDSGTMYGDGEGGLVKRVRKVKI